MANRIGSLIRLRPEYEERYIILHKHVFPEILERIKKSNIMNYSIFLLDGILFSYMEYVEKNYEEDMKAIADNVTKEWWKLTDPMQEPLPLRKEGEWWAEMKLIQHFDEIKKPYDQANRFGYSAQIKIGNREKIKELLSKLDKELFLFFKGANIQNHSTFLSNENLYVYFEYTGKNFVSDSKRLNDIIEVKKWNKNFEEYLFITWKEMKEVFHTN